MMRVILTLLCLWLLIAGCSGIRVESFPVWEHEPGSLLEYRVVEVYQNNFLAPSYAYHVLFQCLRMKNTTRKTCYQVRQNPTIQPGILHTLLPSALQAGGIVGGAALIGSGIAKSGSQTSVSNTGSSHAQAVDGGAGNDVITVNP